MLAVMFWSVGVSFASSFVKSVSKFLTSVFDRCDKEKEKQDALQRPESYRELAVKTMNRRQKREMRSFGKFLAGQSCPPTPWRYTGSQVHMLSPEITSAWGIRFSECVFFLEIFCILLSLNRIRTTRVLPKARSLYFDS